MTELFIIAVLTVLVALLLSLSMLIGQTIGGATGTVIALVVFFAGVAGLVNGFGSILDRK